MTNDYYNFTSLLQRNTLARANAVNTQLTAIATGFAKLPSPTKLAAGTATYAGDSTGSGGDYAVTLAPAPTSYTDGMEIRFKANHSNPEVVGKPTLQVGALAAVQIRGYGNEQLLAGAIPSGSIPTVTYDASAAVFRLDVETASSSFAAAAEASATDAETAQAAAEAARTAAETAAGTLTYASEVDAKAGAATDRLMSPARTVDTIGEHAPRPTNRILNGDFDLWPEGTSLSAGTGARHLAHLWLNLSVGSTIAASRQAHPIGVLAVPGNPRFFHRCVVVSSTGAANQAVLVHRIEDVGRYANGPFNTVFWAKADASRQMSVELLQYFGTGGSPSASVSVPLGKVSLSTSWQRFSLPAPLPAVGTKIRGTNEDDFLQLAFWFDAGSDFDVRTGTLGHQSGTFDVSHVVGTEQPTAAHDDPFEGRTLATEFLLCSRYFAVMDVDIQAPAAGFTLQAQRFPVPMRAQPTASLVAAGTVSDAVVQSITNVTEERFVAQIQATAAGGFVTDRRYSFDARL